MSNQTAAAHPFELSGMGRGPYAFHGIYEMPNLAEDSASNFANPNPYAGAPKLKAGLGTCANCGMAIQVVCIVRDADGGLWGVGSDCAEKTGDKSLGCEVKIAVAKRRSVKRREIADAKREADRQKFLDAACNDSGETNRARIHRQEAERLAKEKAAADRRDRAAVILAPLAEHMRDGRGGWADSVANDMKNGFLPSGRGIQIALDILSKRVGRSGSAAYDAEYSRIIEIFSDAADILATSI